MKFKILITEKGIFVHGANVSERPVSPEFERNALLLASDAIQKRLDKVTSPLNQKKQNDKKKNK